MNRTALKEEAVAPSSPLAASRLAAAVAATAAEPEVPKRKRNKRRKAMNKTLVSILCITLVVGTAGCASRTPVLDEHFGDAVREARAKQTINPDAGRNTDPVLGLNGLAARESIERYKDSTKAPPPVTNVINIGGSIAGGGGGR